MENTVENPSINEEDSFDNDSGFSLKRVAILIFIGIYALFLGMFLMYFVSKPAEKNETPSLTLKDTQVPSISPVESMIHTFGHKEDLRYFEIDIPKDWSVKKEVAVADSFSFVDLKQNGYEMVLEEGSLDNSQAYPTDFQNLDHRIDILGVESSIIFISNADGDITSVSWWKISDEESPEEIVYGEEGAKSYIRVFIAIPPGIKSIDGLVATQEFKEAEMMLTSLRPLEDQNVIEPIKETFDTSYSEEVPDRNFTVVVPKPETPFYSYEVIGDVNKTLVVSMNKSAFHIQMSKEEEKFTSDKSLWRDTFETENLGILISIESPFEKEEGKEHYYIQSFEDNGCQYIEGFPESCGSIEIVVKDDENEEYQIALKCETMDGSEELLKQCDEFVKGLEIIENI